ncbi:hypothetical protein Q3G72_029767 [Acer saccharum]|nr:hypothetical protein Q3G72_029767 [Acer saccharum]
MDRNWIRNPDRACDEYLSGIEEFIGVARNHVNYRVTKPSDDIGCDNDQVMGIINDMYPSASHFYEQNILEEDDVLVDDDTLREDRTSNLPRLEIDKYERLLKEAQKELYPSCEGFSVLTLIVELMQLKVKKMMTNKCFDELMGILKRMLPKGNNLPPTHRHAHKILKDLGLGYEKIHACEYDCVLFYKENEGLDKCPVCNELRYKADCGEKQKIP